MDLCAQPNEVNINMPISALLSINSPIDSKNNDVLHVKLKYGNKYISKGSNHEAHTGAMRNIDYVH